MKIEKVARDYRGMNLCEPCWDGKHFTQPLKRLGGRLVSDGEKFCNCKLGECDCPCSQLRENISEVNRNAKAKRLELAKTQTDMSGFGTIDIR